MNKLEWASQSYEVRQQQLDDTYHYYHADKKFQGTIFGSVPVIAGITKAGNYKTLLDYGSGGGGMWSSLKPAHRNELFLSTHVLRSGQTFEVTCYDPFSSDHNTLPLGCRYDMVMCSDVLEHVLIEDIKDTLDTIFSFADKVVYLNISTVPAGKYITNLKGNVITEQDLHVTVRTSEWWIRQIDKAEMRLLDKEKRFVTVHTKFDKE